MGCVQTGTGKRKNPRERINAGTFACAILEATIGFLKTGNRFSVALVSSSCLGRPLLVNNSTVSHAWQTYFFKKNITYGVFKMTDLTDFLLSVIAVSTALGACALLGIYAVIQKGLSEHIKAMQAFYENTKHKE